MSRENWSRTVPARSTSVSSWTGALKMTAGGGSFGAGTAISTGVSVGAAADRIAVPAIHVRLPSRCIVPVTSTHRPVSTRASGLRSTSLPRGRRPETHTAASAD